MKTAAVALFLSLGALPPPADGDDGAPPQVGWRGDGTGKYPDARPPLSWGMVSRGVKGLRYHAGKPDGEAGSPMADGVIREWLVLDPAPEGARADKPFFENEAELWPSENEKVGPATWKKVRCETAWLNFRQILKTPERAVACAFTAVFSESGGKFGLDVTQLGTFQIVLNGKPLPSGYGRYPVDLAKGWNRLLLKVGQRDADWACTLTIHAKSPAESETANIAWRTPLPGWTGGFYGRGTGCGSLIVVGDRIFLLSEPHDLVCIEKSTGRILWIRTNSYFDGATEKDRTSPAYAQAEALARRLNEINASVAAGTPARLEEKAKAEGELDAKMREVDPVRYKKSETPDVGFSGLTPVSDGKFVYLWLSSGVAACYDLEGNRRWIRVDNLPGVEHGFSSSPVLVDGKVVVFMRDILAIDAASGGLSWQVPLVPHEGANPAGYFHGTPATFSAGGVPYVFLGNGTILRARDGKIVSRHPETGQQAISSPVIDGNLLVHCNVHGMKLFLHRLPAAPADAFKISTRAVPVDTPGLPCYYLPWYMSSPVVHDGLAYLMNNAGVLTVVDLKEEKVLYERLIDVDHFQTSNEGAARGCGISPALAGRHLFFFGNGGAAVVLEPGRTFKQVAKNKIESLVAVGHWGERQERFVSNPVFDGRRLYVRGEAHLYAIDADARPGTAAADARPAPAVGPAKTAALATAPSPATAPAPESAPVPRGTFGFRRDGTGEFAVEAAPAEWSEKKNVKWRAPVGPGASSPIVAGDRVLVLSEPGVLTCLDRADGRARWTSRVADDLPAEVRERLREPSGTKERARATPVTDGARVYATLGTGVVACYSLQGRREWVRYVEPAPLPYGPSASPVLAGGTLLVDSKRLAALEAATGRPLWTAASGEPHYGTPALASLGGATFAVTSKGAVVRVSDGAVLANEIAPGAGGDQAPSPLVRDGVAYFAYRTASAVRLALKDGRLSAEKLWEQELAGDVIASPVLKDGKLFVMPSGVPIYQVLDAGTGRVLSEKEIDLGPNFYPSLALAGGRIYLGNDKGDTILLEAAAAYQEVRRNQLPEGSGASPAFAGSNLYLRGGEFLYCMGP